MSNIQVTYFLLYKLYVQLQFINNIFYRGGIYTDLSRIVSAKLVHLRSRSLILQVDFERLKIICENLRQATDKIRRHST